MSLPLLTYKGFWHSHTNTPSLADGVGTLGDCYHIWTIVGSTVPDIEDVNLGSGAKSWVNGNYIYYDGSTWNMIGGATGGGGGSVTSFSAGNLSPIFSTTVTDPTTTPALSFTLTAAPPHTFLGNSTGLSAAPTYVKVDLGADVSGNLPVANLNSGTGATPTTFWSGAGTWATPAGTVYTGTLPIQVTGTIISIVQADSTHNGYLTAVDWNTFNNKQVAGNYITALTGDVTAAGPGSVASTIAANAVTYAKMQAVSTTSRLLGSSSTTTAVQEISIGSGLTLTGTTLSASGGGTVTSVSGTLNRISVTSPTTTPVIDIDAAYVGQASITTLGTVATGTWNASVIALAYGGTNANLTASNGGIVYSTASAMAILAGTVTANKILYSGATAAPSWSTPTFPVTASATSRKIIVSDGTNWVASTETYAVPGTSGNIMISDGTNWTSAAFTATGLIEAITLNDIGSSIPSQTYTIELYAEFAYTINELKIISGSGTCNAAVQINGTNVTGISAVSVSSSIATGTATAANTVSTGNKITLVISSTSSLVNLQATLKITRL